MNCSWSTLTLAVGVREKMIQVNVCMSLRSIWKSCLRQILNVEKFYKEVLEQTLSTCTPNKFDGGTACVKK